MTLHNKPLSAVGTRGNYTDPLCVSVAMCRPEVGTWGGTFNDKKACESTYTFKIQVPDSASPKCSPKDLRERHGQRQRDRETEQQSNRETEVQSESNSKSEV